MGIPFEEIDYNMKISIITINFNNRDGLKNTIESVVNQTYNDIQYIVIDGGSTDGSAEIIKEYADRINYWVSEPDKGIYNAMNKGIDAAKGEYCLFLNSGDCLHSNTIIEKVVGGKLEDDIVMGLVKYMPSSKIGYTHVKTPITLFDFYKGSPVPHPAAFVRRILLTKYRYDETLKIVSDWKFFLQTIILDGCSYCILDFVITDFLEGGISGNRVIEKFERQKCFEELLPYGIRVDYFRFLNGVGYEETNYDRFYVALKNYKYSNIVYSISVILVRFISLFKPSAKFVKNFPLFNK